MIVNNIKLAYLYVRRVWLVKSHFNISLFNKIKANLRGYISDQYILYNLKEHNIKNYLSEMDWHCSRFINQPFEFVLNNKVICNQVLSHYVRVPEIFAIKTGSQILATGNNYSIYNLRDVFELVKQHKKLFLKPYLGGKGSDVYYLEYIEDQFLVNKQVKIDKDILKLCNKLNNWILCEAIEQHSYANNFYDKTFNTIRIVTVRNIETHQMDVVFAVQRIGTSKTIPVDNGSKGAIIAKIDLETGILSFAKSLHNLTTYTKHPNSQKVIEGVVIPNWEKIKQQIMALANQFSYLHLIAWDILVMQDGNICVVEANNSTGVNVLQLWGGLKQHSFGQFLKYYKKQNKVL
ncbi:sugar-transfer associated ATP-grasp domain-containing protein [Pasteurella atlantica]|uniref:Sugar-transfer associated ATP-grasp domain-containing protein n=2 Tax=Pasteurellaceae TaxID=712 RepID=A0ACC6HND0_9PAST|nr:sugar-transfer associated ATP-grasp domain-containing protein [Pasteurella atlantica]MDP8052294.1 sugar-transfer associated ATP-grasp domain-containing protein [Pasteurella atlantica]MDP8101767.1 sugar-transfer associated ATP-grasp domain-containing protein [Pasteurella atlantica]MDP8105796.1 sugar-transfer associated ATP-grasp domain-containing protein [Pasteurella atlantica]MDP8149139.1 sugar-transfer associated ATP-grasp domain-containing protein [Pasteurella atlantica]